MKMQNIFRHKKCRPRCWATCYFRENKGDWQRPMVILREGNWFTRLFRWAIKIDLELKWGETPGRMIYASLSNGTITDLEADEFIDWLDKQFGLNTEGGFKCQ